MDGSALTAIGITVVSLVFTAVIALVVVVVTIASIAVPFWLIWKLVQQNAEKRARLMATGLAAPAVVLGAAETGMYVNHQPMVRIRLDVRPPGGEAFQASVDRVVSILDVPKIQAGAAVEVRYAAEDRRELIITSF